MFYTPMLLQQVAEPFDHPDYIFEPKADGFRMLYSFIDGNTKLYTRHKTEVTTRFPELLLPPTNDDIVLDGELVVIDPDTGIVDFELSMKRFSATTTRNIQRLMNEYPAIFVVFDILSYQGKDLRHLPLIKRKQILADAVPRSDVIQPVLYVEEKGITLYEAIKHSPFREGIVAKKKNSKYVGKRSNNWLKIIDYKYEKAYISGFKKKEFGWFLSVEENGVMIPMGVLELGSTKDIRKQVYRAAEQLKTHENDKTVYIKPEISCIVKYRNLTKKGYFRSPVFVSWE